MSFRTALGGIALAALFSVGVAHADDSTDAARRHFKTGMAAYVLEHWDEAIKEFEAGFLLEPKPIFLFNMAQAYRLSSRPREALTYYKKYLALGGPSAPNRAEVQEQIQRLERQVATLPPERPVERPAVVEQKAPEPPPPVEKPVAPPPVEKPVVAEQKAPEPTAVAPRPSEPLVAAPPPPVEAKRSRWPVWVGIAAGVVVVGAAVAIGVAASQPGEQSSVVSAR